MIKLIKNVDILTMDDDNTIYNNGAVVIENEIIKWTGEYINLPNSDYDEITDGKGKALLPGFVNTHTHAYMSLMKGWADDTELFEWLNDKIGPIEDKIREEHIYSLTAIAIAEMIMGGVTMFCDMSYFMDEVARAAHDSGMKALLSKGLADPDYEGGRRRLNENKALYDNWHDKNGRIRVCYGPHAVYTNSSKFLLETAEWAERDGVGLHIHIAETLREVDECVAEHNMRPMEYFESLGVLNDKTISAHSVHVNNDEIDIMAARGVNAAHCPVSNLKLACGVAPVPMMLDKGVNVALGTDSSSSNNNLSILKELQLAAIIHKGVSYNPKVITTIEALKMATVNGAKALGRGDETGIIEIGRKADLILMDLDGLNCLPTKSIESSIVYSAYTTDVTHTMADGRWLMKDKEILALDIDKICHDVESIRLELMG